MPSFCQNGLVESDLFAALKMLAGAVALVVVRQFGIVPPALADGLVEFSSGIEGKRHVRFCVADGLGEGVVKILSFLPCAIRDQGAGAVVCLELVSASPEGQ